MGGRKQKQKTRGARGAPGPQTGPRRGPKGEFVGESWGLFGTLWESWRTMHGGPLACARAHYHRVPPDRKDSPSEGGAVADGGLHAARKGRAPPTAGRPPPRHLEVGLGSRAPPRPEPLLHPGLRVADCQPIRLGPRRPIRRPLSSRHCRRADGCPGWCQVRTSSSSSRRMA